MGAKHLYVVDDAVMVVFSECSKREREGLIKIFKSLAESPYQKGEWRQRTKSGRRIAGKTIRQVACEFLAG